MKKIASLFMLLVIGVAVIAQKDPALEKRLADFMDANRAMNMEKVLDYTYPKLFSIVPREQLAEVLKNAFDNEAMTIQLDSLKVDKVYPVFKVENGSFAKILYSMNMLMKMKAPGSAKAVADAMKGQFGEDKVVVDTATNIVKVRMSSPMVAVKDELAKDWCFVNLRDEDPLMTQLFSEAVRKQLDTYK